MRAELMERKFTSSREKHKSAINTITAPTFSLFVHFISLPCYKSHSLKPGSTAVCVADATPDSKARIALDILTHPHKKLS